MTLYVIVYYSVGECNFVMGLKGLIKILVIVRSVRNSELSGDFKNFCFLFSRDFLHLELGEEPERTSACMPTFLETSDRGFYITLHPVCL